MKMVDVDFRIYYPQKKVYFYDFKLNKIGSMPKQEKLEIEFFTGIKDCNGNKIYDGDVLAHLNNSGGIERHYIVRYVPSLAAFFAESIEHPINKPLCEVDLYSVKVVGNIHSREIPNIDVSSIQ